MVLHKSYQGFYQKDQLGCSTAPSKKSINELLSDTSGNDTFYGNTGNDTLIGLSGNDRLFGNAGNDTLAGLISGR